MLAVSAPVKLLHEAVGHVVTLESKSGELYRGHLMHVEDTMNCLMENVKVTGTDGKLTQLDQVFLKGSQIRFVVVPDQLKHAPFFKTFEAGVRQGYKAAPVAPARGGARPTSRDVQMKSRQ